MAERVEAASSEQAALERVTPSALQRETGATGLPGAGAGNGWIYDERLPELRGVEGRRTLRKLSEDPVVWASLYAIEQLVRHVPWRVEPPNDVPESHATRGVEFVESVLFKDMDVPFAEVVSDACTMLAFGFAVHEIVLKRRSGNHTNVLRSSLYDDGAFGVARLGPRNQDTIQRWIYAPDGADRIIGIEQYVPETVGMVTIPYWRTLHYRTTAARGNPEGRPITRGAYRAWVRKQELELAEGRMMARAAGFVEMRVPGKLLAMNATPEERAVANAYQAAADRIAQERQGSLVLPSDVDASGKPLYEVRYVTTDSRRASEIQASIERYDRRIAMTMLTDFLLLGHEKVGSFALSDSKTSIFARSVGSLLNVIADQVNRVLLPLLWEVNGFDRRVMPTLVPGDLEERDLDATAAYLSALAGAGMPLFPDDATENYLRELAGLPPKSETSQAMAQAQTGDEQQGAEAAAAAAAARGAPGKGQGAPTGAKGRSEAAGARAGASAATEDAEDDA